MKKIRVSSGVNKTVAMSLILSFGLQAGAQQGLVCVDILNGRASRELKQTPTAKLQEDYRKYEKDLEWNHYLDNELDFLRFVRAEAYYKTVIQKENPNDWQDRSTHTMHGSEIYGVANYKAFKEAWDLLERIPKGEFRLTTDLLMKVHTVSSKGITGFLKTPWIEKLIPDGYLPDRPGVLKKRGSFGRDPLFSPISDEQVAILRANPWLGTFRGQHGFLELPFFSKPNARRGIILYSSAKDTPIKLKKLEEYYDQMAAKVRKGELDPVELAAELQLAIVSIHPSIDGNGRLSRLIMDRVLKEFDLPPPLIIDTSMDILTPKPEWVKWVREGLTLVSEKAPTMANSGQVPDLNQNGGMTDNRMKLPFQPKKGEYGVRQWGPSEDALVIDGIPFVAMKDGFLYSSKRVPYAFDGKTLYPISDMAYLLYGYNGQPARDMAKGTWGYQNTIRNISPSQKELYRKNRTMLNLIKAGKVDPKSIKLVEYDAIARANQEGRILLYPWQKPMFQRAVTIFDTDPALILARERSSETPFESWVVIRQTKKKNDPFSMFDYGGRPFDVLAQYMKVDAQFWQYQKMARENFPDLEATVIASRKKMHQAARTLMAKWIERDANATAEQRALLEKSVPYRAMKDLFNESPLAYKTFEEHLASGRDNEIVLLRADNLAARKIGFHSQLEYAQMLQKIPGYENIKDFSRDLAVDLRKPEKAKQVKEAIERFEKDLQENKTTRAKFFNNVLFRLMSTNLQNRVKQLSQTYSLFMDALVNINWRIFGSTYEYRGVDKEYDRAFIEHVLHAGGYIAQKRGVSFTSSSSLLTNGDGTSIPFTAAGSSSGVMLVRLDRNTTVWNEWGLSREYEFLLEGGAKGSRVMKAYKREDFKNDLTPEQKWELREFMKDAGVYVSEPSKADQNFADIDPLGSPIMPPHEGGE